MNLRALQLFRQIVLTGTLSQASDKLNMSVSAASRLVSQLERDVGLHLFTRDRRSLELTEDGALFFRQIASTLIGIDEIPTLSADIRGRTRNWLSVVTAAPLANGLAVPGLAQLRRRVPDIRCTINVETRFDIESKVAARGYNLGLISLPVENAIIDLKVVPFLRSRLCLLMHDSHRLAAQETIRLQDLGGLDFATLAPGQRWRDRLEQLLGEAGLSMTAPFETGSTIVTIEMVRANLGVTLIDRICAPLVPGGGLVLRPLAGAHWITYASLHPAGPPAPLAETFLDAVTTHIEALCQSEPGAGDLLQLI